MISEAYLAIQNKGKRGNMERKRGNREGKCKKRGNIGKNIFFFITLNSRSIGVKKKNVPMGDEGVLRFLIG